MRRHARHLIFILVAVSGLGINLPLRAEIVEAQWQVYQIRLYYSGISTQYTCDAIERKLTRLLVLLGARNDARVESSCVDHSTDLRSRYVKRIQRSQRLNLSFAMPVPADKTDISREVIPAEWRKARVAGKLSRYLSAADCELLEHFRRQVLPYLLIQGGTKVLHCSKHQAEYGQQFRSQGSYRRLKLDLTALKALDKTELEAGRKNFN